MNVSCEFLGRLGNGLFQVAAMIGYCKRTGQSWGIPPGYHHRQIYQYFKHLPIYRGNIRKLPVYDVTDPKDFGYKEIPDHPNGVKLRGFFQSYKFFDHAKEEVLNAWRFRHYPDMKGLVSIHVRRGDYVTHNDSFPPITIEYLQQAIKIFTDKGYNRFSVFSDDLMWCKANLVSYVDGVQFQFIEHGTEYSDMSMMSSCDHNIIANSSFSWVAAYANRNPDKIVVSPHWESPNWFGPKGANLDTKDLLPEEWIKIKFR